MAKITIGSLGSATPPPLTGAEILPLVSSGRTKNATLSELPVSDPMQDALDLKAEQVSVDTLNDFRVWNPAGGYTSPDPVFRLGIPYRLKSGGDPSNDPATSPTDWEIVGGGAGSIGNISPDSDGSKGSTGWTGAVATVANGLTGFATELAITADSIWTIPVPSQLQGEALELRFEAYLNAGTGVTVKMYSDAGATVAIPMTQTGLNATGKTAFVGSFWATGANVYLKVAGTTPDLRMTNIYIGRLETVQGSVASPRQDWVPVLNTGALGPTSDNEGWKHRENENLVLEWRFKQTGAGTAGSGTYLISLPDNNTIDLQKKPIGSVVGFGKITGVADEVSAVTEMVSVVVASSTQLRIETLSPGTDSMPPWTSSRFSLGNTSTSLSFTAIVPCAQFTSSMTIVGMNEPFFLSNSESVVNTNGVAGKTQVGTWAPLLANTAYTYYDLTLPRPLMLGEKPKIILRSKVDGSCVPVEIAGIPSLWVSSMRDAYEGSANNYYYARGIWIAKVSANIIRVFFSDVIVGGASSYAGTAMTSRSWASVIAAADGYDAWMVEISRGGEAWAVPPTVHFQGAKTASQSVTLNVTKLSLTVDSDTHGAWSVANSEYTAPVSGLYQVVVGAVNPAGTTYMEAYKNGSPQGIFVSCPSGNVGGGSCVLRLVAGDKIDFRFDTSDATVVFYGNGKLTITRIGS